MQRRHCSCKPGYYLSSDSCTICPKGSYCLGGTAEQSVATGCGPNLNTINFGSRESKDCVTEPGFSISLVDGSAVSCPANTFNRGKTRLTACVPCPAGLNTNGNVQQTSVSGCLIPPGWQGTSLYKAVRCPRGEYRDSYAGFSVSVRCSKCPTGTNTQFSTRTAITECKWVHPGWRWKSSVQTVEQQLLTSAEPAERCPFHSYCPGGEEAAATADGSIPCPNGLWTKGAGAKFARNCSIPIGHYLSPITNAVTACDLGDASNAIARPGSYQPSWLSPSDAAAGACLPCGSGVLSEPVSAELAAIIPPGGGVPLAKVAGPSSSCYIRRGQGLVIDSSATRSTGALAFRAVTCSSGSYGISAKKNGLTRSRCKDCPFGTVTSSTGCTNNPGTECPDSNTGGFYNIDACRYTTAATCGNIRATTSGTAVSFVCTSPRKYDASKKDVSIAGLTPALVAVDTCCSSVYASGTKCSDKKSEITCSGTAKVDVVLDPAIGGMVLSEAVTECCKPVYSTGTKCQDKAADITCADTMKVFDGTQLIEGQTLPEALVSCCKPSCKDVTCTSGTVKPAATIVPDGQLSASFCCNTCATYECTAPTVRNTAATLSADEAPTVNKCCVYPLNSNCGDVDGKSDTVGPQYSCGAAPSALKGQPESLPLAGVDPGTASTTCCITSCSAHTCTSGVKITLAQNVDGIDPTKCCNTCAGYSCPAPTTLRSTLPQLAAGQAPTDNLCCVYRSLATCGDADGPTLTVAGALACLTGANTASTSTDIGGRSPAQAQATCCTTSSLSCASFNCPPPTEVKTTQTGPTLSADLCCAYPSDATCGDADGPALTVAGALACLGGKTNSAGASTTISGYSPTQAQDTCCTTSLPTCAGYSNCPAGATADPQKSGQTLSADLCCAYPTDATCGDVNGGESGATSFSCSAGPPIPASPTTPLANVLPSDAGTTCCLTKYPAGATCGGVYGAGSSTAYSCSPATRTVATDNTQINDMAPAAASAACCTTSCSGVTCSSGMAKTGVPGIVTAEPATCCDTCASITCPNANEKLASSSWPMNTAPSEAVCCTCAAVGCPATTSKLASNLWPSGTVPSADVCCVYGSGATCASTTGTNPLTAYGCPTGQSPYGNGNQLRINGITAAAASSTCCYSSSQPGLSTLKITALGCWAESSTSTRALPEKLGESTTMTVDACAKLAYQASKLYFGVQYAEQCWAGNSLQDAQQYVYTHCHHEGPIPVPLTTSTLLQLVYSRSASSGSVTSNTDYVLAEPC
ncbi:hypothetical protein OEZ86_010217 [Tetradesmus obliquus]|nr:hypothetical protein OEZ86_010217 [Tetradesmus obliquus]